MTDPGLFSKGMGNRSSMKENIITGGSNFYSGEIKPGILDAQIYNRKKGITEIKDILGGGKCNINPDH